MEIKQEQGRSNSKLETLHGRNNICLEKPVSGKWLYDIPVQGDLTKNNAKVEIIHKRAHKILHKAHSLSPTRKIMIKKEKNIFVPHVPPLSELRQDALKIEVSENGNKKLLKPLTPVQPKIISIPVRKLIMEPHLQQKRRIVFVSNHLAEKSKKVVEDPKVIINKKFRNLGVVRVNPNDYLSKYGDEIVSKDAIDKILPQNKLMSESIQLRSESPTPELEGDIEALKLIDLDLEGLSCYKKYLEKHLEPTSKRQENAIVSTKSKSYSPQSADDNSNKSSFNAAFINYYLSNYIATSDKNGKIKIRRKDTK